MKLKNKIFTVEEWENLVWVTVYRSEVEKNYTYENDEDYPCIDLLIPEDKLKLFLFEHNMTWKYYVEESITMDFDGLYDFAKEDVVAMRYSH